MFSQNLKITDVIVVNIKVFELNKQQHIFSWPGSGYLCEFFSSYLRVGLEGPSDLIMAM